MNRLLNILDRIDGVVAGPVLLVLLIAAYLAATALVRLFAST